MQLSGGGLWYQLGSNPYNCLREEFLGSSFKDIGEFEDSLPFEHLHRNTQFGSFDPQIS
jgi:hypothetical protein